MPTNAVLAKAVLTKAKVIVLAVPVSALTLLGLLFPSAASAATPSAAVPAVQALAASAGPVFACNLHVLASYSVTVQVSPTNAKKVGTINKIWAIVGGKMPNKMNCKSGFALIVVNRAYNWHGWKSNKWLFATFTHGKSRVTGYVPEIVVHHYVWC